IIHTHPTEFIVTFFTGHMVASAIFFNGCMAAWTCTSIFSKPLRIGVRFSIFIISNISILLSLDARSSWVMWVQTFTAVLLFTIRAFMGKLFWIFVYEAKM